MAGAVLQLPCLPQGAWPPTCPPLALLASAIKCSGMTSILHSIKSISFSSSKHCKEYISVQCKRCRVHSSWSSGSSSVRSVAMSSKDTQELDVRAAAGETVVPGGTGGKSLEAQQHLADGRSRGGQARAEQLGHEGYVEMGMKGGSATNEMSGGAAADAAGREIDESKFTNQ